MLTSKRFAENWRELRQLWHENFKIVRLTSCTRVVLHPHVRRHFLALAGFKEIPVGYARNSILLPRGMLFGEAYHKSGITVVSMLVEYQHNNFISTWGQWNDAILKILIHLAYIVSGNKSCSNLQQFTGRKCVTLLSAVLWRHPSHRPCLLDVRWCNVVSARS